MYISGPAIQNRLRNNCFNVFSGYDGVYRHTSESGINKDCLSICF